MGSHLFSLLPHPFFLVQKVSCPLNQKLCFALEGSRRGSHFWCWFRSLPYCRILKSPIWPFPLPPARHCSPEFWNVRELLRIIACRIGPFAPARGPPEALTRWPCATQPGLPPLRAQFQSGILIDWSFALVLGLGEFLRVSLRVFYQ